MKTPTYKEILPYIEKGLVSEQSHPEASYLKIFNYTQHCQFEGAWDDVTRQCRGLILNIDTGEVVARPFPKFFNYQEHISKGLSVPSEIPIISEKLDGSLGILYYINGIPWVSTRGSFISEQSLWATDWFRKNIGVEVVYGEGFTHLFEIIIPWNRIVVNYDFSGLVYLDTIHIESGITVKKAQLHGRAWGSIIPTAKEYPFASLEALSKLDEPNSEGFVIFYPEANLRLKIKFPEYVRLHKLVTGVSEIAIWEHMQEGKSLDDLLEKVPDEFFKWVESVQTRLRTEQSKIWGEAMAAVQMVGGKARKDQALWIMENAKNILGVVFSILDRQEKKAMQQVFKMIRPRGQKQFKVDIDSLI